MISFKNKLIQQYLEETRNVNFDDKKKVLNAGYGYQGVSYCIMSSKDDGSFDCESGNIEMLEIMGWFLNKIDNINNKQNGEY